MSMLAERKIKQKWSLNPRGKMWSEDSSKFGQKMLEKMGWSKGKGLGPKENGMIDHLKISYKNDSKGMGYKETDDQWTEHDTNFNALLQTLSGEKPQEQDLKLSSLEEKSLNSKVRVHYKKFTRGKDLSKWSEKDLANIFGKRSLIPSKNNTEEIKEETEEKKITDFTINSGSMLDYFKKKLPNFSKNNNYLVGSNGVLKHEESEEETRPGFGNKRKFIEEIESWSPRKKTKIKKNEDKGLSNPGFDPFNQIQIQKHTLNTIKEEDEDKPEEKITKLKNDSEDSGHGSEEHTEIPKKKKKKKKTILEDIQEVETKDEEELEESKKKKKKKSALDNPNFEDTPNQSSLLNEDFEIKRKKKKEKFSLVNPSYDESETHQSDFVNENYEIKRKKKRKTKDSGIENPNFDTENSEGNFYNSEFEVKRKKKKLEDLALDNPNFDTNDNSRDYVDKNYEIKRKKNKNKLAIDNPNFQDLNETPNSQPEPTFDLVLNITSTPVPIQSTTPSKSSLKRRKSVRFSEFNEERIIPSKEDIENRNELFDINSRVIANSLRESQLDNSLEEISKKIEGCQAEVENDINEKKCKFIGEVGRSYGNHEKLENGTKLKLRDMKFQRSPAFLNKVKSGPKASYKHLIIGDIVLEFKNTNLHEIEGYGVKK